MIEPMSSPVLTRRQLLQGAAAGVATGVATPRSAAPSPPVQRSRPGPYAAGVLPPGVRSRFVAGVNGLRMHVLEAGSRDGARAGVLLLHGFPELAYSWRRLMPALAAAGYLLAGAGHWVQQEQSAEVNRLVIGFLLAL